MFIWMLGVHVCVCVQMKRVSGRGFTTLDAQSVLIIPSCYIRDRKILRFPRIKVVECVCVCVLVFLHTEN